MQNSVDNIPLSAMPKNNFLHFLQQSGWKIPPPQRQRIAPPPFEEDGVVEYLPEIHMLVPKGWRLEPPGDKCVCDRCIQMRCTCIPSGSTAISLQIESCLVHGQDTLVGRMYRALHALHNEEIAKEIAMDPTKEQEGL